MLETQAQTAAIFPTKATLFSGQQLDTRDMAAIDALVGKHGPIAGYLVAESEDDALYLLFLKGKPYAAGCRRAASFEPLTIREFVARMMQSRAKERDFTLFAVDPAILLLIAVQFQKRPILSVSSDLVNPAEVLAKVEESARDAIIAVVDGGLRHVVFCQKGLPVRFYPAAEVTLPVEETLSEVITVFCFERGSPRPVSLEVFDELAVAPASDRGLCLAEYAATKGAAQRYELQLFEGAQVLETLVFQQDRVVIGRSDDVDLRLDDVAVSRAHCEIVFEKGRMLLRDLGSDNGTLVNNVECRQEHALGVGDEIRVGRVRLLYKPLRLFQRDNVDETVHLDPSTLRARLVHLGESFPIYDDGIFLGSAADAGILVRGLLVKSKHARIYRHDDGRYLIEHLGGWRRTRVNGAVVDSCTLRTGDSISIARETLRFYDAD